MRSEHAVGDRGSSVLGNPRWAEKFGTAARLGDMFGYAAWLAGLVILVSN